ncbi:MAG TPA: S8 family serine peptidase [Gemmatimonadales bacterium]|nr:S8 family serine peptidase [Gemmatimonadales bacterium]
MSKQQGYVILGILVAIGCVSTYSCDSPSTPTLSLDLVNKASHVPTIERDMPWRDMSDSVLEAKIQEAGGSVFIGFKDSSAAAGVNERGVTLASASSVANAKERLRQLGVTVRFEYEHVPAVAAHMAPSSLPLIRHDPLVEYVEPIFPGRFASQDTTWNVRQVSAPVAWAYSTGSGAKLLIIDSGVDSTQADLAGVHMHSCVGGNGVDTYNHGTRVANIAAALDNSSGIIGVAPGVNLYSAKIDSVTGVPGLHAAACAVEYGISVGVNAMNISAGWSQPYQTLTDDINDAYNNHGIVVVVSAGDETDVVYPATLGTVIAVSGVDSLNNFAGSASAHGAAVELAAPGWHVPSICLSGSVCLGNGTSYAAPAVAAAAALLKSYNSSWSNVDIRNRLAAGAKRMSCPGQGGYDNYYGWGILDVPHAISLPLDACAEGPSDIGTAGTYEWRAWPKAGTGSYSYQWAYKNAGSSTWNSLGTSISQTRYVDTSNSSFTIRVKVVSGSDTVTDSVSVGINPVTNLDLSGPTWVHGNQVCHWTATPTGGTPPYVYNWQSGAAVDTTSGADTYGVYVLDHMWVDVSVTAANGAEASSSVEVYVEDGAPGC